MDSLAMHDDASGLVATLNESERGALARAQAQLNQVIVGKSEVIAHCLAALLAGGHVLLEDMPGVGKTTLAHAFARTFALDFRRVQFTSDLLPADLVGVSVYRKSSERFDFVPGPLFTQLLLADELNRGSAKTQSALLEAMAEAQITVDGQTRALVAPFFVIATQNPQEQAGTFALPESQLDRFMLSLSLGYPDAASERALLAGENRKDLLARLAPQMDAQTLQALQRKARGVTCSSAMLDYLQRLIGATRNSPEIRFGLSPRAALALVAVTRARALISGRDYAIPEDAQAVFVALSAHRLSLATGHSNAPAIALAVLKRVAVV
jgi:MoxR-like ATPase